MTYSRDFLLPSGLRSHKAGDIFLTLLQAVDVSVDSLSKELAVTFSCRSQVGGPRVRSG